MGVNKVRWMVRVAWKRDKEPRLLNQGPEWDSEVGRGFFVLFFSKMEAMKVKCGRYKEVEKHGEK